MPLHVQKVHSTDLFLKTLVPSDPRIDQRFFAMGARFINEMCLVRILKNADFAFAVAGPSSATSFSVSRPLPQLS
jgi:hypothetical protein